MSETHATASESMAMDHGRSYLEQGQRDVADNKDIFRGVAFFSST